MPIDCFCCASANITLKLPTSENGINFANYNVGDSISIYSKDNNSFTWTVNGSSYTISADGTYKGLLLIKRQFANVGYLLKSDGNVLVSNIGNTTLTGITSTLKGYYAAGYDPIELGQADNYSSAIGNLELQNYTEILIGGTSGTLSSINTINSINKAKYIALFVCLFIELVLVTLISALTVERDSRTIALKLAIGIRRGNILFNYIKKFLLTLFIGLILGIVLSMLTGGNILSFMLSFLGCSNIEFIFSIL